MFLILGVLFSIYLYNSEKASNRERIKAEFERLSQSNITSIRFGVDSYIQMLRYFKAFYSSSERVVRDEFRRFAQPSLRDYEGIQALEWIPRVPDSERSKYESDAQSDGFDGFTIMERKSQGEMVKAKRREEYYPVYFVEPLKENEAAVGFDLASNKTRLEALNFSRDTGKMTATSRITLVQETGNQYGFLIFLPIYEKGVSLETIDLRRNSLKGFILGVFRVGDIVNSSLKNLGSTGIDINILDMTATDDEKHLYSYRSSNKKRENNSQVGDGKKGAIDLKTAQTIDVGGRKWKITLTASSRFISSRETTQPFKILFTGLLFTVVLAGYMIIGIGREEEAQELQASSTFKRAEGSSKQGGLSFLQVISFLLITVVIAWYALEKIEFNIKKDIGNSMETVLKTTHEALQIWAHDRLENLSLLASTSEFTSLVKTQLQLPPTKENLKKSPALKRLRSMMAIKLKEQKDLGFFVISSTYENIASMRDMNIGEVNLLTKHGNYLEKIFKGKPQLILPLVSDVPLPSISGKLAENEPTMFLGVPVYDEYENIIAAFTIRLDPSRDFSRITQLGRIGKTGETYSFDQRGKLITESRFDDHLRQIGLIKTNQRGVLSISIRDPGGDISKGFKPAVEREHQSFTKMAESALSGGSGLDTNIYRDYRGVEVVGAWLWDKELAFGLATEIDATEAFRSYRITRIAVFFVLGITLALSLGLLAKLRKSLSEASRLYEEAKSAKEEAVRATLAKSEFLASMSHEIRTPMNAIIGMADLLKESELSEEQKKYVQTFSTAGDSLLVIIDDILDLSKIEAGQFKLESVCIDIEETIEMIGEMMAFSAQEKGLELVISISPEIPKEVLGDPTRLRQVAINLLSNAVKFTDRGEVLLSVEPKTASADEIELLFMVRDTGIGIPIDKQKAIFEDFTQADSSTTRKYGGTGLGLSISMRIVGLMGGRIWVESEVGSGSTFLFTVKFGLSEECNKQNVPEKPDMSGFKVLIVDDNETNRMILEKMLSRWGAETEIANNGQGCLDAIRKANSTRKPFDLIMLDFNMPDINGVEVASRIKKDIEMHSGTPIVVLTPSGGYSVNESDAKELGLFGCVYKPLKQADIRNIVSELLNKKKEKKRTVEEEKPDENGHSLRILLVEDTPDNVKLILAYLMRTNHVIDVAENGEIAVEKFIRGNYDLVLMDLEMPVMDGYTATRKIREWELEKGVAATPIVALTAHALSEHTVKATEAGCNEHLAKPLKKAVLMKTIEKFL
jgi:signal transduction histidine kinase/DNA-binding response OmpR family regulator/CHASE1-domain containing sensor protein